MSPESQLSKTLNQFIGPCAHGSDPYDRCEECEWLSPIEAKVVALNAEIERLNKRLESEQYFIDSVCHYRNLAIVLGAKPEQMLGKFDRELCEGGIDPNDTSGGYHVSVNQQLGELADVWAELDASKAEVERLRGERDEARKWLEGICTEFESTIAHAEWRAAGSKGMSVPFFGDFADAARHPGMIGRMGWWVKAFRAVLKGEKP